MKKISYLFGILIFLINSFVFGAQRDSKAKKSNLYIGGMINPLLTGTYDGYQYDYFVSNNDIGDSRLNMIGSYGVSRDLKISGVLELGFRYNNSATVSQLEQINWDWELRLAELIVNSSTYGKLSFGKGQTASEDRMEEDISGTSIVSNSATYKIGGGLIFRNSKVISDKNNLTVSNAFYNLDGFSRQMRVRYDTPEFYGFTLAGSLISDQRYDVSLSYNNSWDATKLKASLIFTSPQTLDTHKGYTFGGSFSVLSKWGVSLTGAAGGMFSESTASQKPWYAYGKLGYLKEFCDLGDTAISVDFGHYNNFDMNNLSGYSATLVLLQNVKNVNLSFFGAYRIFDILSSNYKPVQILILGASYNFGVNI